MISFHGHLLHEFLGMVMMVLQSMQTYTHSTHSTGPSVTFGDLRHRFSICYTLRSQVILPQEIQPQCLPMSETHCAQAWWILSLAETGSSTSRNGNMTNDMSSIYIYNYIYMIYCDHAWNANVCLQSNPKYVCHMCKYAILLWIR
jgi:hypothetical protein